MPKRVGFANDIDEEATTPVSGTAPHTFDSETMSSAVVPSEITTMLTCSACHQTMPVSTFTERQLQELPEHRKCALCLRATRLQAELCADVSFAATRPSSLSGDGTKAILMPATPSSAPKRRVGRSLEAASSSPRAGCASTVPRAATLERVPGAWRAMGYNSTPTTPTSTPRSHPAPPGLTAYRSPPVLPASARTWQASSTARSPRASRHSRDGAVAVEALSLEAMSARLSACAHELRESNAALEAVVAERDQLLLVLLESQIGGSLRVPRKYEELLDTVAAAGIAAAAAAAATAGSGADAVSAHGGHASPSSERGGGHANSGATTATPAAFWSRDGTRCQFCMGGGPCESAATSSEIEMAPGRWDGYTKLLSRDQLAEMVQRNFSEAEAMRERRERAWLLQAEAEDLQQRVTHRRQLSMHEQKAAHERMFADAQKGRERKEELEREFHALEKAANSTILHRTLSSAEQQRVAERMYAVAEANRRKLDERRWDLEVQRLRMAATPPQSPRPPAHRRAPVLR